MHISFSRRARAVAVSAFAALVLGGCATVPAPTAQQAAAPETIQILGLNDFHGNIEPPNPVTWFAAGEEHKGQLGGAARLGATLGRLRQGQLNTITVAAGDLTVLANHTPMLVELKPGIVALSRPEWTPPLEFFIAGGFADISNEHCIVLTPQAVALESLQRGDIEEKLSRLSVDLEDATDDAVRARLQQQIDLLHLQLTVVKS